jgi:hypothetical protein
VTTSAASAGSPKPALFTNSDALLARVSGVVVSPRAAFEALVRTPRSLDVLCVATALAFVSAALLYRTEVGQLALLDQWERTAIAFRQGVSDQQYAAMQEATRNGVAYAALTALAGIPLLAAGLALLLRGAFRLTGGRASYRQVLAVTAHASVILALRQAVAAPISYARETLASPMTLTMFVTGMDEASPMSRFLGMVDLFVLWWLVALAIGFAVLYGRSAWKLALSFAGLYLGLALLVAGVVAVLGGTR